MWNLFSKMHYLVWRTKYNCILLVKTHHGNDCCSSPSQRTHKQVESHIQLSGEKNIEREISLGLLFTVEMIYTIIWNHWTLVYLSILHTDVYSPHLIHTFCRISLILHIQSSPRQWAQHLKKKVFLFLKNRPCFYGIWGYRNIYYTF